MVDRLAPRPVAIAAGAATGILATAVFLAYQDRRCRGLDREVRGTDQ